MHAAAAGSIVAAMSDLDGFTAKLNAILQADLTHAGGWVGGWVESVDEVGQRALRIA